MKNNVTRRQFLGTTGLAAGGVAAGLSVHTLLREARAAESNERFTVGLIGCGGMGRGNLRYHLQSGQCDMAVVCDIDDAQISQAVKLAEELSQKTPQTTKDYRKILDNKDIDVVIVATPDHWHAIQMLSACAAGKDVYCEKPCCHNIHEGRRMVNAARKYKRVVQVGTLQRSLPHIVEAKSYIQSGKLGLITMTNTYTYGNEAPHGMGPAQEGEVPPGVDYNRWLGPAPQRPFHSHRFHRNWRWYYDYGCGMVGDWNVHLQDIVQWVMNTPYPISVSVTGGKYVLTDDRDTPDTMQCVYEFPTYVQTFSMRKASGKPWNVPGGHGMDFHGTNGFMHIDRQEWHVEGDRKDWENPKNEELRVPNEQHKGGSSYKEHVANFLECLRTRKPPVASIELHYPSVVSCHLANISYHVGRRIFWDAKRELCFTDRELTVPDPEANKYLTREYRRGFELPNV